MKFGVHIALWMTRWHEDLRPHIELAAQLGFDGVELSLIGLSQEKIKGIRRTLNEHGLEITCTTGLAPDEDITSDDAATRQRGVAALKKSVETAAALDSSLLCGVIYAPWGKTVQTDRADRWRRAVDALKVVAEVAARHELTLGIEAINRYETDLVNTAAQATALANAVGHEHVGVLLDSYHMNIEEKDIGIAVKASRDKLVHLHVVENDRGVPGSGHIPWSQLIAGIKESGYKGWCTLEMFIQAHQPVSSDLAIWRAIEDDPTEAARRGLAFLKERFA